MKAPLSWIRDYVDLPDDVTPADLAHRLTALGLKLEALHSPGAEITGPLVVGRVLSTVDEPQKNGKTIKWCQVDCGPEHGEHGVVCGAHNFGEGDLVVVSLPGTVLPGGFEISARKTYGHVSDGMICSTRELGIGDSSTPWDDGILVLDERIDLDVKPGDSAVDVLGLRDDVIEFEINPDRAYALSLRGIAREAALAYDVPFHDPALREVPAPNDDGYPVRVEAPDGCPVFVTRTVIGFDPSAPTPRWMARRVQLAGMRPISLAVDVTNYVMLELGNPIHGYDADKLAGPIVVRRAAEGESITTLDDVRRPLSPEDLLITDDSGPIGIAGVMGGESTELSADTTSVVVEAAHFEATGIFRTARRHRLHTEGAKRWERGVDPLLPAYAADRVAHLLVEHGGGTITDGVTYVGGPPEPGRHRDRRRAPRPGHRHAHRRRHHGPSPARGRLHGHRRRRRAIPDSAGADLAARPHRSVRPRRGGRTAGRLHQRALGAAGRATRPRAHEGPAAAAPGRVRAGRRGARRGEVVAVHRHSRPRSPRPRCGRPAARHDPRRQPALRRAPAAHHHAPSGAAGDHCPQRRAWHDLRRSLRDRAGVQPTAERLKAPILGVAWRPDDADLEKLMAAVPRQPLTLGVVLVGERQSSGWWGAGRGVGWADAIQVVREVARVLAVEVTVEQATHEPWHPGRCARFRLGDDVVGYAGELLPSVCEAYGVPPRTSAVEVDLDLLVGAAPSVVPGPEFSTYPVAKEDVALVVDADLPAALLEATLREGAGELLESVRIFDVYTGAQAGEGKKSLAFALRFRAPDRTLTEAETGAARDAAVALAAQRHGAVQR